MSAVLPRPVTHGTVHRTALGLHLEPRPQDARPAEAEHEVLL